MGNHRKVMNVVFAGLGGQGILKASDILSEAAFRAGFDVKKSEIHGMSQRGGSVTSDVRYGEKVFSPMVPAGEAEFLVVLDVTQVTPSRHVLREDGVLITPELFLKDGQDMDDLDQDSSSPVNKRNLNVALLGALSIHLDLDGTHWMTALHNNLPKKLHAMNEEVFAYGKSLAAAKGA
jgi:indolepyruvate ferredoxin oxidoreductase, beta subunit